jgi:hypothetical protein
MLGSFGQHLTVYRVDKEYYVLQSEFYTTEESEGDSRVCKYS